MIDWVSCTFPYHGPSFGKRMLQEDLKSGQIVAGRVMMDKVEGSWSSGMQVQAIGREMYMSGNPVKFLTGQNVFGTDDLRLLIALTYKLVLRVTGLPECLVATRALRGGTNVRLSRVDCTFHFEVGSDDGVRTWLKAMEKASHVRNRGRGHYDDGMCSLMYGLGQLKEGKKAKASSMSSFKFYNKFTELKKHPPTCPVQFIPLLFEYTEGKVRAEATIRGKELKRHGKNRLSDWDVTTSHYFNSWWIGKMDIKTNVTLRSEDVQAMPRHLISSYKLWMMGEDLQQLLSKSSFYRQRREFLEFDIDITCSPAGFDNSDDVRVIPVIEVLQARPVDPQNEQEIFERILRVC